MFKRVFKYILVIVMFIIIGKVDAKVLTIDEVVEEFNSFSEYKIAHVAFGNYHRILASTRDADYANYTPSEISADNNFIMFLDFEENNISFFREYAPSQGSESGEFLSRIETVEDDIVRAVLNLSGYESYKLKDEDYSHIDVEGYSRNANNDFYISLDTDIIDKLVEAYGEVECPSILTATQYVIKYNVNGGKEIKEDSFHDMTTYEFPTPEKEGYVFVGWYSDKELTNKVEKIDSIKFTKVLDENSCSTGEVQSTLYAEWSKDQVEEDEVDVDDTKVNLNISIILISLLSIIIGSTIIIKGKRKNISKS